MLCDLSVYRIFQVVPADVEGKDGPIIPAEDWVEKETMKSVNGWIEVNNDCLVSPSPFQVKNGKLPKMAVCSELSTVLTCIR